MPDEIVTIAALDAEGLARHLDALADILVACVHDGASVSFVLPFGLDEARAFWTGKVAPGVAGGTRALFVAACDGVVAATAQLDLVATPNQRHRGEVSKVLVHPSFRRLGLARALMGAVEARAQAAGRWLLTLDTAGEAAERLYLSLGYACAGRIPSYARDPIADRFDATTIMYKDLRAGGAR